jgi:YD repeat-containing protein
MKSNTLQTLVLMAGLNVTSIPDHAQAASLYATNGVNAKVNIKLWSIDSGFAQQADVLPYHAQTISASYGDYNWTVSINNEPLKASIWGYPQGGELHATNKLAGTKQPITISVTNVFQYNGYILLNNIPATGSLAINSLAASEADKTRFSPDAVAKGGTEKQCPKGMAGYSFNALHASLRVQDTPLAYAPPVGSPIAFSFVYNQRDNTRDTNVISSNFGQHWTLSSLSYVEDAPASPTNTVRCYLQGGGSEDYTGFTASVTNSTRNAASQCILSRTATNAYARLSPDGSRDVYSWAVTLANGTRRIFLTQQVDTSSNTLSYAYDTPTNGTARLTQVTDALGQSSTLTYGYPGDALKPTSISDPFNRSVQVGYIVTNGAVRLASLIDPVGIVSSFTYSNDFINSLTTPYGTTTFATSEDANSRAIEATDPLGATEHLEFRSYDSTVSNIAVPSGLIADASSPCANTYYWDARAWSIGPNDVSKAQIIHWALNADTVSGVPLWTKDPLEQAIVFNFAGQTDTTGVGLTNESPTLVGRMLDGGVAQTNAFRYDAFGNLTNTVDPVGRTNRFVYSTNGVDLLEIDQRNGAGWDVLATLSYNAQHLPTTTVIAGVTNRYGYASNGLLLKATNGLGQVTTFNYNPSGYLTNITGHLPTDTLGITCDAAGRMFTLTDSDGYTVTNTYDDLDRLTNIAFPDGTSRQYVYNRLDVGKARGRDNRWTYFTHEAPGRLTDVQDPLGRLTHFARCSCGDLEGIMDPKGNYTSWLKDDAGRTQTKLFSDRSATQFTYATNLSQLKNVTFAQGNTSALIYNADGSLQSVSNSVGNLSDPIEYDYSSAYPRLWTLIQGSQGLVFGYVPAGQPGASSLASITGDSYFPIFYTNDVLGRIQSSRAGSAYFKVQYDDLGRVYWSSNNQGATTATYDGASARVTTIQRPNGITTVYGYTAVTNGSQLQFIWHTNQAGLTLARYDYGRDVLGHITRMTNAVNGTTTNWAYQYDPAGQLLSATASTSSGTVVQRYHYGYDAGGNRISQQAGTSATAEQVNGLNQLTNRAGTGGVVWVAGYLSETGTVIVAGAPARMTTTTNFEGEVYALAATNVVTVVAIDLNGNAATNSRTFTIASNGSFGSLTYDLNGNLLKKTPAWTSSGTSLTTAFTSATAPATPA